MIRNAGIILLLCFLSGSSYAQDAGYWASGYSAGGFFAPGGVIAFNKDSGVAFYNPALLAWSSVNTATISGTLYQYESIHFKNGAGDNLDLRSHNTEIIPQLLSGNVSLRGKRNLSFSYALLREPEMNYKVSQRIDTYSDVLDNSYSNGAEKFIGEYTEQNHSYRTSLHLSAAMQLSANWSAGLTLETVSDKHSYLASTNSWALHNGGPDSLLPPRSGVSDFYTVDFAHSGIRAKLGFSYNQEVHHWGILFTSPLIRVGGKATLLSNLEINNLTQNGETLNLLGNTRQTGLKVSNKIPFSIALGYAYDYNKTGQIYFTTEYFAPLARYNVFLPHENYFVRSSNAGNGLYTMDILKIEEQRRAVLNIGLGVSFPLASYTTGYAAIRSDFSYLPASWSEEVQYMPFAASWNSWHIQLGSNFRQRKFNLRAGLLLSYSHTGYYLQKVNFNNAKDLNLLQGELTRSKAGRFAAGLMVAYIYNLQ